MILSLLVSTSALLAPSPSEIALDDMVKNARAANLFAAEGNTISSPANVLMLTLMVAEGVGPNERTTILSSLDPGVTPAGAQAFAKALSEGLDPKTTWIARAVWSRNVPHPRAAAVFREFYGADMAAMPTQSGADEWANRQTNGMIPQFPINIQSAQVVFASALAYINQWQGGDQSKQPVNFQFAQGMREVPGFRIEAKASAIGAVSVLRLPYVNGEEMLIFYSLGAAPTAAIVNRWGVAEWREAMQPRNPSRAFVRLPCFEAKVNTNLLTPWEHRGRPVMAPFPGFGEPMLNMEMRESAFIRVDEKGTKAASVAAMAGTFGGAPTRVREFTVDRPFVFAIVRPGYPLPLFIGTVNAPTITP